MYSSIGKLDLCSSSGSHLGSSNTRSCHQPDFTLHQLGGISSTSQLAQPVQVPCAVAVTAACAGLQLQQLQQLQPSSYLPHPTSVGSLGGEQLLSQALAGSRENSCTAANGVYWQPHAPAPAATPSAAEPSTLECWQLQLQSMLLQEQLMQEQHLAQQQADRQVRLQLQMLSLQEQSKLSQQAFAAPIYDDSAASDTALLHPDQQQHAAFTRLPGVPAVSCAAGSVAISCGGHTSSSSTHLKYSAAGAANCSQPQQQQQQMFGGVTGSAACSLGLEVVEPLFISSGSTMSAVSGFSSAVEELNLASFLQAQHQQQQAAQEGGAAAVQQLFGSYAGSDGIALAALNCEALLGSSSTTSGASSGSGGWAGCNGFAGTGVFLPRACDGGGSEGNVMPFAAPGASRSHNSGCSEWFQAGEAVKPPVAGAAAALSTAHGSAVAPSRRGGSVNVVQQQQQQCLTADSKQIPMQQSCFRRTTDSSCNVQQSHCRPEAVARRSMEELRYGGCQSSSRFARGSNGGFCTDFGTPVGRASLPAATAAAVPAAEGAVPCCAPRWAPLSWDPKAQVKAAMHAGGRRGTGAFIPACMLPVESPAQAVADVAA